VGTHLSNIRRIIKSRSTLASILIIPAIVCGLALLGFQTYSLITGKSFKDLDFDIGKLWSSPEETVEIKVFNKDIRSRTIPLFTEPIGLIKSIASSASIRPPALSKKVQTFLPMLKNEKTLITKSLGELIDIDNIKSVKIGTAIQSPQMQRYYSRLESEYLINPDLVPNQGQWYVGLNFAPSLGYRTFSYDPSLVNGVVSDGQYRYTYGLTESNRNMTDRSITSYSIGIDVGRRLTNKISLFSGFNYAHYGEQLLVSSVDQTNPNYEASRFMDKNPLYERHNNEEKDQNIPFTNKYSYFEIPLGISLDVANLSKAKVTIDAAVHYQRLDHVNALVYDFETDYYYWADQKESMFRRHGLATSAGITLSQYVTERFEVFVNPQFKFNLTSTFQKPYPVTQNQYTSGLRIGFKQQVF
jgi:hypothetical protein